MPSYKKKNNLHLLLVLEHFEKMYISDVRKLKFRVKNFGSVIRDENFNATSITNEAIYVAYSATNLSLNNSIHFRRYKLIRRHEISIT